MNSQTIKSKKRSSRKRRTAIGGNIRYKSSFKPLKAIGRFLAGRSSLPAWFSTFLLVVFFFVYASDFVVLLDPFNATSNLVFTETGGGVSDEQADEIASIKSNFGIYIYAFTLFLAYFYKGEIISLLRQNIHFVLTMALILIGMSYSTNSTKVLFSVIQLSVGFIIAAAYAVNHQAYRRWDIRFCCTILVPLVLVHLASIGLIYFNEIDIEVFILGDQRYGGLSGNPNTAGAQAVIGIWLCFYLLLDFESSKLLRLFALLVMMLFSLSIILSGSGTSITAAILIAILMIWLRVLVILEKGTKRLVYFVGGILVIILLFGGFLVNNSTEDLTETFTTSLGKRTDFTGRTGLWETAGAAFREKPILGWSLDNHESVQENRSYALPSGLGHYHNGYLDTLVSGGLVLGLFILYNFWRYIVAFWQRFKDKSYFYGMIGPFIILVVMNFSEYSLMRPLNILYQLYLCTFCLLAIVGKENASTAVLSGVAKRKAAAAAKKDRISLPEEHRSRKRYRF